jgi:superfamily II DNA or RNA helicase
VISRRLEQLERLTERLEKFKIKFRALSGATETGERDYAKSLLMQGRISVLLASTIFDEGEDVPSIDAVVLAEGVKTNINALQRVGRGMRKKEGANDLWVVDFVPLGHPKLIEHGLARTKAFESREYETTVERWPMMPITAGSCC